MDAATVLKTIFDPDAEKEHLSLQRNENEAAHEENQQTEELIRKLEQENEKLTERLSALADPLEGEIDKLKKLIEAKRKPSTKNSADFSFNINRAVTGYAFTHEPWNKDHQIQLMTCYYNENCYIRIVISSDGQKDLLEIVPNHPNFLNIRKFLVMNQDVAGLLAHMLKYFKLLEQKHQVTVIDT